MQVADSEPGKGVVDMITKRSGVGRLVRRLERERRRYAHAPGEEVPTEQAWRAGIAEGIRLAQLAIRKGV
jgi:hypothetical protein